MSYQPKTTTYVDKIFISNENFNRLLMWAQSEREINFICFGKNKIIENVFRLSNISRFPQNFSMWNENEKKKLIKEKKKIGQSVLAWGHSHPKKHHDQFPSEVDIKLIPQNQVELIVFPHRGFIGCWKIQYTQVLTLRHEIHLQVI